MVALGKQLTDFVFRFLGDTTSLERAAKKASRELSSTEKTSSKAAKGFATLQKGVVGLGAAFVGSRVVSYIGDTVSAASDLEESVNAVEVTMGGAADEILAFGRTAASSLGLSQRAVNEAATAFSAFGERIAPGNVAGVFQDYITRATDFASVMNIDMQDALDRFRSGLAGESEPLRRFGLDLSAATVGAYAVANGIAESASKMTEAQKVQARYGTLMEQTNKVAGDFANTSDSLANQQRILAAEWENAQARLGEMFVPLAQDALPAVVAGVGEIRNALLELRKDAIKAKSILDFLPGISDTPFAEDMQEMIWAAQQFYRALEEGEPRADALETALLSLHNSGKLNALTLGELTKELNLTDEEMVAASRAVYDYAESHGASALEIRSLTTMFGPYLAALRESRSEQGSTGKSAKDLLFELEGLTGGVEDVAGAGDDAADAVENLSDELRKAADPVYKARDAVEAYEEALEEAQKDGEITADELVNLSSKFGDAEAAKDALTDANLDAFNKQLAAAAEDADATQSALREAANNAALLGDSENLALFINTVDRLDEITGRSLTLDFSNLRFASDSEMEQAITRALLALQRKGVVGPIFL